MKSLLALLIVVACLGLVAAWIGENPGMVEMIWFDYKIETSVAVLLLLVIVAGIILTFIYNQFKRAFSAPSRYAQKRNLKHYQLGLSELTHSVAALAASDIATATKHTRKAEKALGVTPLTLLLRAQISKGQGSDEETRELLEQLLGFKETEYLAAKSLSDAAQKQKHLPQALVMAERAHRVNPRESHGAWAVFDLHLNEGHFQEAEAHAIQARKSGGFTSQDLKTARGRIALRQAENLYANGQKGSALQLAKQAYKLMPGHMRAAELCANLHAEINQPKQALSVIEQQWHYAPSPALAELFCELIQDEKDAKREKMIARLRSINGAAPENVILDN